MSAFRVPYAALLKAECVDFTKAMTLSLIKHHNEKVMRPKLIVDISAPVSDLDPD